MNNSKYTRSKNIKNLEKLAKEVLKLKEQYRQRRPIVVELCGCPKAGKTSYINALNIFLKRNGFKTEVLKEKASICPISDKKSPTFNLWTCAATINEINEKIDAATNSESRQIDIILCDRGIFDTLCWFDWLRKQKKMRDDEYRVMNKFVMLNRWQRYIDLVYVFITEPKISIQREYLNLLTDKRGSIMNEDVLSQYRDSVIDVYKKYKAKFRKTDLINTSDEDLCNVVYNVTTNTLNVLKDVLMERIGYIEYNKINIPNGINEFSIDVDNDDVKYGLRNKVEENNNFVQPIAIAVLVSEDNSSIFCVRKTIKSTENDSPEYGKDLFYVGGHMRAEDLTSDCKSFLDVVAHTLERELEEELGVSFAINRNDRVFSIYIPNSIKSKKHFAIGWIIYVEKNVKFKLDRYELIQKKGKTKSGSFINLTDIGKRKLQLEDWSKEILKFIFKDNISEGQLIQLGMIEQEKLF